MSHRPHFANRFCVALAAIGLLLSFSKDSPAQPANSTSRLQSLVNDAVTQLQLSYRHDPAERRQRHEEIGRAIAAWNKSARSEADNEKLADWLRQAMRASMPGSHDMLPPVPEFQRPAAVELKSSAPSKANADAAKATSPNMPTVEKTRPATGSPADDRFEGDPFRDDPIPAAVPHEQSPSDE